MNSGQLISRLRKLGSKKDRQGNAEFIKFLKLCEKHVDDERNFVKKAVNWAIRAIGERNRTLNNKAIQTSLRISKKKSKSVRGIVSDALSELQSGKVQATLNR